MVFFVAGCLSRNFVVRIVKKNAIWSFLYAVDVRDKIFEQKFKAF